MAEEGKSEMRKSASLAILMLSLLAIACMPAVLQGCQVTDLSPLKPTVEKHSKLDSALNQLLLIYEAKGIAEATIFAKQHGIKLDNDEVRVIVEVKAGKKEGVTELVKSLGGNVETGYENLIQAIVPIAQLKSLANDPDVKLVRLPIEAIPGATQENQ